MSRKRPRLVIGVPSTGPVQERTNRTHGWWRRPSLTTDGSQLGSVPAHVEGPTLCSELTPRTRYEGTFGAAVATMVANPFSKTPPVFHYAVVHTRGRRRVYEDRHSVYATFLNSSSNSVYAVFDGHGGSNAAEFAARNIAVCLEREWDAEDHPAGIRRAFLLLDSMLLRTPQAQPSLETAPFVATGRPSTEISSIPLVTDTSGDPESSRTTKASPPDVSERDTATSLPPNSLMTEGAVPATGTSSALPKNRNPYSRSFDPSSNASSSEPCKGLEDVALPAPAMPPAVSTACNPLEGTTALVAIILGSTSELLLAHVGDSRALVTTAAGEVLFTTQDHSAVAVEEARRVRAAGGFVDPEGRVDGLLAMSRSLGDAHFKMRGVIAEPTVSRIDLRTCRAAVLATDGLWETVSATSAAAIMRDSFSRGSIASQAQGVAEPPPLPDRARNAAAESTDSVLSDVSSDLRASAEAGAQMCGTTPTTPGSLAEPRVAAERLVAEARLTGASDDCTVLVIDFLAACWS